MQDKSSERVRGSHWRGNGLFHGVLSPIFLNCLLLASACAPMASPACPDISGYYRNDADGSFGNSMPLSYALVGDKNSGGFVWVARTDGGDYKVWIGNAKQPKILRYGNDFSCDAGVMSLPQRSQTYNFPVMIKSSYELRYLLEKSSAGQIVARITATSSESVFLVPSGSKVKALTNTWTPVGPPPDVNALESPADLLVRAKWDKWQTEMRSEFDKAAAVQGPSESRRAAWDRFIGAYSKKNPFSNEDDQLRAEAMTLRAAIRDGGQVKAVKPLPTTSNGAYSPGSVFKDCPDCPEMVVVPAGNFTMGSSDESPDEKPLHPVTISHSFAVAKYAVTQAEWEAVMGSNPSTFKEPRNPVEMVSWNDAQEFISRLNAKLGYVGRLTEGNARYRLLTEAEWEYAARAGTTTKWHCGSDETCLSSVAVYKVNSGDQSAPVGSKSPNAFGLYDMHGNVRQWVQDCYVHSYADAPVDGSAALNVKSFVESCSRVNRGGCWNDSPYYIGTSYRIHDAQTFRSKYLGFRIAKTLP